MSTAGRFHRSVEVGSTKRWKSLPPKGGRLFHRAEDAGSTERWKSFPAKKIFERMELEKRGERFTFAA